MLCKLIPNEKCFGFKTSLLLTESIKSDEHESTSFQMFFVTPCFEDFKRLVRKRDTDGGGSLLSGISSTRVGSQFRGFIANFFTA